MKLLKRLTKKVAVFSVITAMMIPSFTVQAANFTDTADHWAGSVIEKWAQYKILNGFGDGTVRPDEAITRAQLSVIINKFMGYTLAEKEYADVAGGQWYYNDMMALKDKGVFSVGADNKAYPDSYMTREEAVVAIAKAFNITSDAKATNFKDDAQISSTAKPYIAAMQANGYVVGDGQGYFLPKDYFTRAHIFTIINSVVGNYVNTAKAYEKLDAGNVVVNAAGAIIKDSVITGDLYITPAVKNGDVTLDNVTITGRTIIQGGGANSIHLKNKTRLSGGVIVRNTDRTVRIAADSTSTVDSNVEVTTDVILDGSYKNVIIVETGAELEVRGKVENVSVEAKGCSVVAAKGASITTVVAKATAAVISGAGEVKKVEAKANDVVVTTGKTQVAAATGVTGVKAGATEVKAGSTSTTNTEGTATEQPATGGGTPSGDNGGSSNGDNNSNVVVVTTIDRVSVEIPAPNDSAPKNASVQQGSTYSVVSTTWEPKDDSLDVYKTYVATVKLQANSGYKFPADGLYISTHGSSNGPRTTKGVVSGGDVQKNYMTFTATFEAFLPDGTGQFDLKGFMVLSTDEIQFTIQSPLPGGGSLICHVADDKHSLKISGISGSNGVYTVKLMEPLVDGKKYKLTLTKPGYVTKDHAFTLTSGEIIASITRLSMYIPSPVNSGKPQKAEPWSPSEPYTVVSTIWDPNETFDATKDYRATVVVQAKPGYKFPSHGVGVGTSTRNPNEVTPSTSEYKTLEGDIEGNQFSFVATFRAIPAPNTYKFDFNNFMVIDKTKVQFNLSTLNETKENFIGGGNLESTLDGGSYVGYRTGYSGHGKSFTITLNSPLEFDTEYTLTLTRHGYVTYKHTFTINKVASNVIVTPTAQTLFNVGDTAQLQATVYPTYVTNKDVTWSSSDTAVATVDNTGKVTAVSSGTATITATSKDNGNVKGTCEITVQGSTGGGPEYVFNLAGSNKVTLVSGAAMSDTIQLVNGNAEELNLKLSFADGAPFSLVTSSTVIGSNVSGNNTIDIAVKQKDGAVPAIGTYNLKIEIALSSNPNAIIRELDLTIEIVE